MSTTLTNGLKLPDKGSVDWYADMQNNYTILDGAVGTIAEHTSALSGKAPLVHTHTKSDITDFPAYGNAAGTICEGNDSRLSDARTPVAHIHGKADITDLLNSDFIPSANNAYDLGSSSYQWNNLYANNYYYNGVAWGLDKANEWSASNTFTQNILLKNTNITDYKSNPSSDTDKWLQFWSNEWRFFGAIGHAYLTTGVSEVRIAMSNWTTSGSQGYWHLDFGATKDFSNVYFSPSVNNTINLGTSTNKWKSLNGINPGALSLPDYSRTLNIDTTNWSKSVGQNNYTPAFDGWLQITIPNDTDGNGEKSNFITILDSGFDPLTGITASDSKDYRIQITFPVVANHEYYVYIKSYSQTIMAARLIKCLGNVV